MTGSQDSRVLELFSKEVRALRTQIFYHRVMTNIFFERVLIRVTKIQAMANPHHRRDVGRMVSCSTLLDSNAKGAPKPFQFAGKRCSTITTRFMKTFLLYHLKQRIK
jgi:hypothetical protein